MNPSPPRVVLVTGLSGAGKASVLHALEDLGWETMDNLPFSLLEEMLTRLTPDQPRRLALGVDVRSRGFDAAALGGLLERLRRNTDMRFDLVYCQADDTVLLRRYTETRRRHPLSPQGRVADGIAKERALTAPLQAAADFVVDTSERSLAALRQWIDSNFGQDEAEETRPGLAISLVSFGYPAGLPREADLVFDMRCLANPFYEPDLRELSGEDAGVAAYIERDPAFAPFFERLGLMLRDLLPAYARAGKRYLTIAIGCTGGRHRSVHTAKKLAETLENGPWRVALRHRDIHLGHE